MACFLTSTLHLRTRLMMLLLLLATAMFAQTDTLPNFPEDFVGDWAGELQIFTPMGIAQRVPMQLKIHPLADTAYTYTIIYGEDEVAGARPYIILPGPDGPHHWICDEKNTILLDGYYLGNIYQSVFTVQGNYLISTVEHRGDHLVYAIQSGKTKAVRISGDATDKEEEIPEVASFKVGGYQRAILTRPKAGGRKH